MKIQFWSVGKTHDASLDAGIRDFTKRIGKYFPVEWMIIPQPKTPGPEPGKKEAVVLLDLLKKEDFLVALDEKGNEFSSVGLSQFIQQRANDRTKNLIFLIGGAYGLDKTVLQRANFRWSLSALTFPHQLVRLILAEQVYRACSILRNEKYHHA